MLLLTTENNSQLCSHKRSPMHHNIEIYRWIQLFSPFACYADVKGDKIIACEKSQFS